jgi:dienelactone hydrolase
VILLLFVSSYSGFAQRAKWDINAPGIEVYNHYNNPQGFYVFSPADSLKHQELGLVIFIHGYGGLNPINYGAWIRQLVEAGNAVIYPRYQRNLFMPGSKKFAPNAAAGIRGGLEYLQAADLPVDTSQVVYIGHSYGGTLSSFMMARQDSLRFPEAYAALLAAPGTNRFKGSRLSSYSDIPRDVQMVIVTHEGDHTTGTEFAELVHQTAPKDMRRVWIKQAAQQQDTFAIQQGHNECYALDYSMSNGLRNYNSKRAMRIGCIDAIDRNLYWPISLEMVTAQREQTVIPLLREMQEAYEFGTWPNGSPLEALPLEYAHPIVAPAENQSVPLKTGANGVGTVLTGGE